MSAYIVSDNTIHAIVKGLEKYQQFEYYEAENFNSAKYRRSIIIDLQQMRNDIGQSLLDENYRSVNYRYREEEKAPKYSYKDVEINEGVLLGCINCYIYQACETDDFFESKLYRSLLHLKDAMLERMIQAQGYEIPWGYEE